MEPLPLAEDRRRRLIKLQSPAIYAIFDISIISSMSQHNPVSLSHSTSLMTPLDVGRSKIIFVPPTITVCFTLGL